MSRETYSLQEGCRGARYCRSAERNTFSSLASAETPEDARPQEGTCGLGFRAECGKRE